MKKISTNFIKFCNIALITGLFFIVGCSARFIELPYNIEANDKNVATVIIMWEDQFMDSGFTFPIKVDNKLIAHIGSGDYIEFQVPAGRHIIAIQGEGWQSGIFKKVEARPEEKIYLYMIQDMLGLFILYRMSEEEGLNEFKEHRYDRLLPSSK